MPAVSKAQRRLIAIAEHHPEEVQAKNQSILGMKQSDMHDFASTAEKGLPQKKKRLRFGGVVFAEKETAPKRRLPRFGN